MLVGENSRSWQDRIQFAITKRTIAKASLHCLKSKFKLLTITNRDCQEIKTWTHHSILNWLVRISSGCTSQPITCELKGT